MADNINISIDFEIFAILGQLAFISCRETEVLHKRNGLLINGNDNKKKKSVLSKNEPKLTEGKIVLAQ